MLMVMIQGLYWEILCSLKLRDLGRLCGGDNSESGVLLSYFLEWQVCLRGRRGEKSGWARYSGSNERLGVEAEHFVIKNCRYD